MSDFISAFGFMQPFAVREMKGLLGQRKTGKDSTAAPEKKTVLTTNVFFFIEEYDGYNQSMMLNQS
jgi:uncharacterized protein YtpQ (UPF0354 family)